MAEVKGHQPLTQLRVSLDFGEKVIPVGRLASRDHRIYFEYFPEFISLNLNISPFRLPLEPGLKTFAPGLFEGLPGVFNDSLPDGWGRLLLDRLLKSQNILPEAFSPLDRLAHVGRSGLGALIYEPDRGQEGDEGHLDLDNLADHSRQLLEGDADEVLQELLNLNGSSAGARSKVLIGINPDSSDVIHGRHHLPEGFEHWIVKFANVNDGPDAGAIEYVFSLMAKEAGLNMTDTKLIPSGKGAGYFATKRFDRTRNKRLHMHTASGLLHSDFRTPSLDYENLVELTEVLTRDVREGAQMYRLAVFNVLAHNRDDHGKNFSYLMDGEGNWRLAPAYDLTFSSGPGGEQSTMVMGEGKNPQITDLTRLADVAGMASTRAREIMDQVQSAVKRWPELAREYGVSKSNIGLIANRMK
ncbi:MAG: type II toxin-antitoxin system HipA family toxin [Cyclobacteriaceae bacterium]